MDATNNISLGKGLLLVSEPFLTDPNFERSVVLLCEHNEEGSVGFVLNHSSNLVLSDVIDIDAGTPDYELFVGGPVEHQTLHFLHSLGEELEGSTFVCEGVYWGGSFDQLKTMMRDGLVDPDQIRFFIGYSGWSNGQLEKEANWNSWFATPANEEYVFKISEDELWRTVLKQMGGKYKMYANYPLDPRMN